MLLFLSTYVESGVRRRTLAEKLRKLPLSYFGKKDLADLTNTIMSDCALLETASSHWIPELIGAMISTTIIVISLLFFDFRMALASNLGDANCFCNCSLFKKNDASYT